MDPNACLAEIDSLHADLHTALADGESTDTLMSILAELAERVTALDLWLVRGGFHPAAVRA